MIDTLKPVASAPCTGRSVERDLSWYGTVALVAVSLVLLASLFFAGCSGPGQAHAVNAPTARESLKIALDSWRKGENPKALQSSVTPMTIQDFDWASGAKLVDYEILDQGKAEDANLRVQVKLKMSAAGKPASSLLEKKVWYLVGTSPAVTVFRDMLRR
jgi:hypothetical protein